MKQYIRHVLYIRKVKTESFVGLEQINSIYVISDGGGGDDSVFK